MREALDFIKLLCETILVIVIFVNASKINAEGKTIVVKTTSDAEYIKGKYMHHY